MLTDSTGHRVADPSATSAYDPLDGPQDDPLIDLLQEIGDEVARAEGLHAPINSAHEGYSVILEELDEFWEQVRLKRANRDPEKMRRELIETAAMCVRTIRDVVDRDRVSVAG